MCGVFGIYAKQPGNDIISKIYFGLFSMQHRGQESCGIAWQDGQMHIKRGIGLLNDVFAKGIDYSKNVRSGIGHVRYSTSGGAGREMENVQPLTAYLNHSIALVHNGNISNVHELREEMLQTGRLFSSTSDSEIFMHRFAMYRNAPPEEMLRKAFAGIRGAFNLVFLLDEKLVAVRDPWGFRALFVGKSSDGTYAVASEDVALMQTGFTPEFEIAPGEAIIIDDSGPERIQFAKPEGLRMCSFEFLYFTRPDCYLNGRSVYAARKALGRKLFEQRPTKADVVVGVPNSGLAVAVGYSEASGIREEIGLAKNQYVGRSFILPNQEMRRLTVSHKLWPIREALEGKSVILVDDSIVRGTTSKQIVACIRAGGAKEVHVRIASPMIRYSCYYGIDTSERKHLIASTLDEADICRKIGADSLAFIDVDAFSAAINVDGLCLACFNGSYLPGDHHL